MALFDEFGVLITADNVQFRQAFQESSTAVEGFKKKLKEAGTASDKLNTHLGTTGNRAKKYGTEVARARQHTANLAAQFNDIGVMMAAGQSPFILAMQQGTQINQVFQSMGNNMRDVSRSMVAALKSIISPMSLLTIGVIAGAAALVQWGVAWFNAGKAAETALGGIEKHQIENLNKAVEEFAAKQRVKNAQIELNTETEEQARLIKAIAAAEVELAKVRVRNSKLVQDQTTVWYFQEERHLEDVLKNLKERLQLVGGLVGEEKKLVKENEKQQNAQNIIHSRLLDNAIQLDVLISKTNTWANSAAQVAKNFKDALLFAGRQAEQAQKVGRGRGLSTGGSVPQVSGAVGMADQMKALEMEFQKNQRNRNKKLGGGGAAANRFEGQIETLRNQLISEEQLELESFQRRQETLQTALEQRYLTQQEHDTLMQALNKQHSEKMAEIDVWRYGTAAQQMATGLGTMANIFQQGNEKMQKIAQVFGAGEALINAWRAYSQTLADPSLPFFAKFTAAASVLAAGFQAVSAIKNLNSGGGGGSSAGAASAGTGGSTTASGTTFNVALQGQGAISRDSVRQFLSLINEEIDNGAIIKGINVV